MTILLWGVVLAIIFIVLWIVWPITIPDDDTDWDV